ncbi:MAG TPA: hypothetical protein VM099_10940 [Gemmatimonadaceae bacterium]|nr:hypothetical protein [Gemmatimonadaceae bacterium]
MKTQKNRYKRQEAPAPTPFQEARDEMFQQIMKCGVIGSAPEDQKEWFDGTIAYLAERYHELGKNEIAELRVLGERFVQPAKVKAAV